MLNLICLEQKPFNLKPEYSIFQLESKIIKRKEWFSIPHKIAYTKTLGDKIYILLPETLVHLVKLHVFTKIQL